MPRRHPRALGGSCERKLGQLQTASAMRNWRTVLTLLELVDVPWWATTTLYIRDGSSFESIASYWVASRSGVVRWGECTKPAAGSETLHSHVRPRVHTECFFC